MPSPTYSGAYWTKFECISPKTLSKEAKAVPATVPKPRDSPSEKPFFAFRICARPSFSSLKEKKAFLIGAALSSSAAGNGCYQCTAKGRKDLVVILSHQVILHPLFSPSLRRSLSTFLIIHLSLALVEFVPTEKMDCAMAQANLLVLTPPARARTNETPRYITKKFN